MRTLICLSILLSLPHTLRAQLPIAYQVNYATPGDPKVRITLILPEPLNTPLSLVMPRNYPGGYEQIPYDSYVENVEAFSDQQKSLSVVRDPDAPRWTIGAKGQSLRRIEYQIDLARMEARTVS